MSPLMDQNVSLFRGTIGQDASGARTITYSGTASLTGLPASIQPASSRDMDIWSRRGILFDHWIYSSSDFDTLLTGGLKLNDKIVDAAGGVYIVQSYLKHANSVLSISPLYKIICQRVIS